MLGLADVGHPAAEGAVHDVGLAATRKITPASRPRLTRARAVGARPSVSSSPSSSDDQQRAGRCRGEPVPDLVGQAAGELLAGVGAAGDLGPPRQVGQERVRRGASR